MPISVRCSLQLSGIGVTEHRFKTSMSIDCYIPGTPVFLQLAFESERIVDN